MQNLEATKDVEAYLEKLKESVSSLEVLLHRTTAPNLKALEKMREVKDKLQGVKDGNYNIKLLLGGLFCDTLEAFHQQTDISMTFFMQEIVSTSKGVWQALG